VTNQDRISNLQALGYTAREAEFLCLAALHSGYFVRRQFVDYAGRDRGKLDTGLTQKILQSRHAKEMVFRHRRAVYSLCSKPFFKSLGDVDNRNRRNHEVITIKNRLVGLDFVLAHRDSHFLATEQEKVSFFRDEIRLGVENLPAKRFKGADKQATTDRYFVEKFPIAVERKPAHNPIPVFSFIDESAHSIAGFESFVAHYRSLFARLEHFRLIYIGTLQEHFASARRLFERVFVTGANRPPVDPMITRLLGYFSDRDAYEKGDLKRFDQVKLIRFREDRREFSTDHFDSLFDRWKGGGDSAVVQILSPETATPSFGKREFETYLSAFRYDLFGTLTIGDWSGR
jgi:hypothetical protein